jgi:hypothetical protein
MAPENTNIPMKSKLLVLALAPAMLIACPLFADDATTTGPAKNESGDRREQMIARFDANGDGVLDETERATAREAAQKRGGPGGPAGPAMREHFMKRYDADGDGSLSEAEKAKGQADWKAFVSKHDADGDGKLSPAEAKAARQAWAQEHPEAAARIRDAVDSDGDGTVSRQEKRAAAKEMRKKRKPAGDSNTAAE